MATLQSGKCFTVPTFFGMCCRSEWQERMYIYKWHEVDQTKHEIFCSYCLQWNTSQSKFRNHYFVFLFAFSILSQLFLIWGCINILQFCQSVCLFFKKYNIEVLKHKMCLIVIKKNVTMHKNLESCFVLSSEFRWNMTQTCSWHLSWDSYSQGRNMCVICSISCSSQVSTWCLTLHYFTWQIACEVS